MALPTSAVRLALGGKVDVDAGRRHDAFANTLGNSLVTMEQDPELGSFTPAQQADYQATIDASAASAIDATNPDIQLSLAANQSMMDTAQQAYGDNHAYAMDLQDAYNSSDNVGADLQNMAYDVGYGLQDNPNQGLPSSSSLLKGISLPQIDLSAPDDLAASALPSSAAPQTPTTLTEQILASNRPWWVGSRNGVDPYDTNRQRADIERRAAKFCWQWQAQQQQNADALTSAFGGLSWAAATMSGPLSG